MIITENKIRSLIKKTLLHSILNENSKVKFSDAFDSKQLIIKMLKILDACKDRISTLKLWSNDSIEDQKNALKMLFKDKDINNISAEDLFFDINYDEDLNQIKLKFNNSPLEIMLTNCLGSGIPNDKRRILIELIANDEIDQIINRLIKTVSYRSKNKKNVDTYSGVGKVSVKDLSSDQAKIDISKGFDNVKLVGPDDDRPKKK
jgi:hypothetical protein